MHVWLFDIDGTLIRAGGAGGAALAAALTSEFGVEHPDDAVELAGRTDRAITVDSLRRNGIEPSEENLARFFDAYLRHLPVHLAARNGFVLPGVRELLDALALRDDVVVGLLTGNFRRAAELKLGHFALADYFRLGGYGDHHLDRDDVARDAVAEIHRLEGLVHDQVQVWVVGDTPYDVRCGRAIGARVIAVGNGFGSREDLTAAGPDHLLEDLSDSARLLGLIAG